MKCRRRDLNLEALCVSVTYRIYLRIESIELMKRSYSTHLSQTRSRGVSGYISINILRFLDVYFAIGRDRARKMSPLLPSPYARPSLPTAAVVCSGVASSEHCDSCGKSQNRFSRR